MNTFRKPSLLGVVLAGTCLLSCLSVRAAEEEGDLSKTYAVQPGGQLVVEVDRGSIDIVTGSKPEVVIDVKRKVTGFTTARAKEVLAQHEVTFEQEGDKVTVRAKSKQERSGWFNNPLNKLQVQYRISVPEKYNLDVRTAGGDINCADIEGTVKAHTSGGNLRFETVKGPFDAHTSGGGIKVAKTTDKSVLKTSGGNIDLGEMGPDTVADTSGGSISIKSTAGKLFAKTSGGNLNLGELGGPADVQTSGGSIRIKLVAGNLTAKTSGGDIKIEEAQAAVVAQSSAGGVSVNFSKQPDSDCRLSTSAGTVEVAVAENVGFELEASTSAGHVQTDIPVQTTVLGKYRPTVLKGKLNGGGKALQLKSSAGDVHIRKL